MSSQNDNQSVSELIHAYAEALNSGNVKSIGGFYTDDGRLFPNGYTTVSKKKLDAKADSFFNGKKFHIQFVIEDISIHSDVAVAVSTATATTSAANESDVIRQTRDLFVLHRQAGNWKIHRYMFNNASNK